MNKALRSLGLFFRGDRARHDVFRRRNEGYVLLLAPNVHIGDVHTRLATVQVAHGTHGAGRLLFEQVVAEMLLLTVKLPARVARLHAKLQLVQFRLFLLLCRHFPLLHMLWRGLDDAGNLGTGRPASLILLF